METPDPIRPLAAPAALAAFCLLAAGCSSATGSRGSSPSIAPTPAGAAEVTADAADRTAAWFEAHRDRPTELRTFLQRMPKGADLHNHLSGAVYAESYLAWAAEAEEAYCVEETADALRLLICGEAADPVGDTSRRILRVAEALEDARIYNRLIDLMSTRNLTFAGQSGHDQFFATFAEFGSVSRLRVDDMVAQVASRAAAQHVFYLELMLTLQGHAVGEMGRDSVVRARLESRPTASDFAAARERLDGLGLERLVAAGRRDLDSLQLAMRQTMRCDVGSGDPERDPEPGCAVTVRYLQQTSRTKPPGEVFAQLVYAVELAKAEPRVVGLNMVAPEDDRVALRDYELHMRILDFLVSEAPEVNVALHAGELALGMVPPEELRFHIRQAVELGHAKRIGHGVDIPFEDDAFETLRTMRERRVAVEICLTSNDVILGVKGADHPFQMYADAGVPMVLATDDEGVSRIDLSNEYHRAAVTYELGYHELKTLARNGLEYSFLPGESLWRRTAPFEVAGACDGTSLGSPNPGPRCREFLRSSERAREQWRLESELAEFERIAWEPR